MSAHNQIEALGGGLLMGMMISAERGRDRAVARRRQAQDIAAHNQGVARVRAARRRAAATAAAQIAVGQSRMARWIDRTAH